MTIQEEIIIGVDSGGTKTIGCAVTSDGTKIGMGYGGPTNANFVSEENAVYAMREAVAGCLGISATEFSPLENVRYIYMSAPGFSSDAADRALRDICPKARIKVEGDAPAAFRAALPSGDGVVVLSGTGSFACGLWDGNWLTNGGWGPLLGDEGSGYWIGLEALRAVALAADKRGPETKLQAIFRRALHYSFDEELRTFAYKKSLNRQRIAGLTILVNQAAREGDEVARAILIRAGEKLADLAQGLVRRLRLDLRPIPISLVGGVARKESLVVSSFRDVVEKNIPSAQYVSPHFEPWMGAVLLAFEMAGVKISDKRIKDIYDSAILPTNN